MTFYDRFEGVETRLELLAKYLNPEHLQALFDQGRYGDLEARFSKLHAVLTSDRVDIVGPKPSTSRKELGEILSINDSLRAINPNFLPFFASENYKQLRAEVEKVTRDVSENRVKQQESFHDETNSKKELIRLNVGKLSNIRRFTPPSNDAGLVQRLVRNASIQHWEPDYTLGDFTCDLSDASGIAAKSTGFLIERSRQFWGIMRADWNDLNASEQHFKQYIWDTILSAVEPSFSNGWSDAVFAYDSNGTLFGDTQRTELQKKFLTLYAWASGDGEVIKPTNSGEDHIAMRQFVQRLFSSTFLDRVVDRRIGQMNKEQARAAIYHGVCNLFYEAGDQPFEGYKRKVQFGYKHRVSTFSPRKDVLEVSASNDDRESFRGEEEKFKSFTF